MAVTVALNEVPFHETCGKVNGLSVSLKNEHLSVTVSFSSCSSAVMGADVKMVGSGEEATMINTQNAQYICNISITEG